MMTAISAKETQNAWPKARLSKGPRGIVPTDLQNHFLRAGLGMRHAPILVTVATLGPSSVGQIADHVTLTPASTSQLVNELAKAGLVHRSEDPHDRRRIIVTLAPEHQESIQAIAAKRMEVLREAMSRLTDQEREHFLSGWRTLIEVAEEMMNEPMTTDR